MDESKVFGGDQELRTPTLIREHPIRGESRVDFLGESVRYTSLIATVCHDNNNHRTSKHATSRCGEQVCVMECADVPDVSNAERSGDLSYVVSRAETL